MSITPIENPTYDVCLWPIDPACLTDDWNALSESEKERSLALASATLRRLTGYRVGGCPITVRPCKKSCAEEYGSFYGYGNTMGWKPHINLQGQWVNGCGCATDCSCGPICEVRLPAPIGGLIEVNVGGTIITDVKVQGDRVVYTGTDDCPFPSCQDLAAPVGAPNTFAITYLNSYPVDGSGAYAVAVLAMEFAKACAGNTKCRLPRGTTMVARQGVTIEVVSGSFPNGFTGIQEVDAYINLWRPEGSPKVPPRVWSPGMNRPRVERA